MSFSHCLSTKVLYWITVLQLLVFGNISQVLTFIFFSSCRRRQEHYLIRATLLRQFFVYKLFYNWNKVFIVLFLKNLMQYPSVLCFINNLWCFHFYIFEGCNSFHFPMTNNFNLYLPDDLELNIGFIGNCHNLNCIISTVQLVFCKTYLFNFVF